MPWSLSVSCRDYVGADASCTVYIDRLKWKYTGAMMQATGRQGVTTSPQSIDGAHDGSCRYSGSYHFDDHPIRTRALRSTASDSTRISHCMSMPILLRKDERLVQHRIFSAGTGSCMSLPISLRILMPNANSKEELIPGRSRC